MKGFDTLVNFIKNFSSVRNIFYCRRFLDRISNDRYRKVVESSKTMTQNSRDPGVNYILEFVIKIIYHISFLLIFVLTASFVGTN